MEETSIDRAALLEALNDEFRLMSAQSVLLSQAVADRVGVHSTDLETMDILAIHGPLTAGRLAELTGLTTGAVTGLIDRLEAAGYVRREKDPRDRRRVIVQPDTERAMREIGPLYESISQAMADLCARYSDAELALVLDFTTRTNRLAPAEIARIRAGDSPGERPPAAWVAGQAGDGEGRGTA
jgi:DNA-binding MarR family transcriptional regulator